MSALRFCFSGRVVQWVLLLAAMGAVGSYAAAQNRETPGSVTIMPTNRQEAAEATVNNPAPNANSASGKAKGADRLREGTRLIDVAGAFQSVGGESVTFSPGGNKDSFRVLENLAFESFSTLTRPFT